MEDRPAVSLKFYGLAMKGLFQPLICHRQPGRQYFPNMQVQLSLLRRYFCTATTDDDLNAGTTPSRYLLKILPLMIPYTALNENVDSLLPLSSLL